MLRVRTSISAAFGGPQLSTHYFPGTGSSDAATAAAAVRAFWDALKGKIGTAWSLDVQNDVVELDPATGQPTAVHNTETALVTGTGTGDALPYATQGLVQWRTGVYVGGREIRGRTFIPGPLEADNAVGFPLTAYTSLLTTAAGNLASAGLAVYSYTHRQFADVSSGVGWTNWASLRSRRDA